MKKKRKIDVRAMPELIMIVCLILIMTVYCFTFMIDWTLIFKTFIMSKDKVPDKDIVIIRLEGYKNRSGKYPNELKRIGVDNRYGSVLLEYFSSGDKMELCYHHFPYLGGMASCYDSENGEWELR